MAAEQSINKIGKSVGEKIRAARIALKYTQSQLASPDFSVSYISAIERGQIHPSLRALEIIAARLGLASTQFLPQRPAQVEGKQPVIKPEREDDEGEFVLLMAHQLLAQEKAQETLTLLGKISAKRMKREQQLQHRYLTGCAHFQLNHLQECEHIFTTLIDLAKEANNSFVYLHTLDMLGATYAASQNYDHALLSHHQCLDLLLEAKVRDTLFIFHVYTEIGDDYTGINADDEAREMFLHALEVAHEFETLDSLQRLYMTLSSYYAEQNDLFVSILYIYEAALANEQRSRVQQRSHLYYALGRAIVEQDSRNHANNGSHTDNAAFHTLLKMQELEKRMIPQDVLTIAGIDTCIAQWLFAHQRLQEALQSLQEAMSSASDSEETLILADAHLLFGRIEYTQQQFDAGDEHFTKGLAILERLHIEERLADQAMYYAQQLEERGKDREALFYFRRAFKSNQDRYVGA